MNLKCAPGTCQLICCLFSQEDWNDIDQLKRKTCITATGWESTAWRPSSRQLQLPSGPGQPWAAGGGGAGGGPVLPPVNELDGHLEQVSCRREWILMRQWRHYPRAAFLQAPSALGNDFTGEVTKISWKKNRIKKIQDGMDQFTDFFLSHFIFRAIYAFSKLSRVYRGFTYSFCPHTRHWVTHPPPSRWDVCYNQWTKSDTSESPSVRGQENLLMAFCSLVVCGVLSAGSRKAHRLPVPALPSHPSPSPWPPLTLLLSPWLLPFPECHSWDRVVGSLFRIAFFHLVSCSERLSMSFHVLGNPSVFIVNSILLSRCINLFIHSAIRTFRKTSWKLLPSLVRIKLL